MSPWMWLLYIGAIVVGLCIVIFVVAAAVSAVRDSKYVCEKCGHRKGDPIDGPPIMRTRPGSLP